MTDLLGQFTGDRHLGHLMTGPFRHARLWNGIQTESPLQGRTDLKVLGVGSGASLMLQPVRLSSVQPWYLACRREGFRDGDVIPFKMIGRYAAASPTPSFKGQFTVSEPVEVLSVFAREGEGRVHYVEMDQRPVAVMQGLLKTDQLETVDTRQFYKNLGDSRPSYEYLVGMGFPPDMARKMLSEWLNQEAMRWLESQVKWSQVRFQEMPETKSAGMPFLRLLFPSSLSARLSTAHADLAFQRFPSGEADLVVALAVLILLQKSRYWSEHLMKMAVIKLAAAVRPGGLLALSNDTENVHKPILDRLGWREWRRFQSAEPWSSSTVYQRPDNDRLTTDLAEALDEALSSVKDSERFFNL